MKLFNRLFGHIANTMANRELCRLRERGYISSEALHTTANAVAVAFERPGHARQMKSEVSDRAERPRHQFTLDPNVISDVHLETLRKTLAHVRGGGMVDIKARVDARETWFQADWVKYLREIGG